MNVSSRTLLFILSFFICILGLFVLHSKSNAEVVLEGRPIPEISMPTLTGEYKLLNSIEEDAALIVTFASWCKTCFEEHPFLLDLQQKGYAIYGIAWMDEPKNTERYLSKNGNPFKTVFSDPKATFTRDLRITGTPELMVVRNGQIIYKHLGHLTAEKWEHMIKPMLSSDSQT